MLKLSLLTILIVFTCSLTATAQSEKLFTLEQLIPGGAEYSNYTPRIHAQYQWNGNSLAEIENDSVWIYNNPGKISKKTFLFNFTDIQNLLKESSIRISSVFFFKRDKFTGKISYRKWNGDLRLCGKDNYCLF